MPHKRAWLDAGWKTQDLNLTGGRVLFVHEPALDGFANGRKEIVARCPL
jgi:hypothetical protein